MRYSVLIILFFFSLDLTSQTNPSGIIFKTGISNATQQWGQSPIAHIRPPSKSIQSAYLFLGYDILKKSKTDLVVGLQFCEKGFRISYSYDNPSVLHQEASYQYLLKYVELPIFMRLNKNRFYFSGGVVFSYLFSEHYGYKEKLISTNRFNGNKTQYDIAYEISYNDLYNRINKYDLGALIGVAYEIKGGVELDLTIQKHFIQIDNWKQKDLVYNLVILAGIKLDL